MSRLPQSRITDTASTTSPSSRLAERGFTLIEILIAAFIFGIVITSAISIFSMTLNIQNSTRESRELVQEERLAMEQISRDIRISNGAFIFCNDQNCNSTSETSGNALKVTTDTDTGQEERIYYVDSSVGTLGYKVVGSEVGWQQLFSDRYKVSQVGSYSYFNGVAANKTGLSSSKQPYVTIKFQISNADSVKKESEKITQTLDTSITTRSYQSVGNWYQ